MGFRWGVIIMQDGFGGCLGDLVMDISGRMTDVITRGYHTKTKRGASINVLWRLDQGDPRFMHTGHNVADSLIDRLDKAGDKVVGIVIDNRWTDVAWLNGRGVEIDV